MLRISEYIRKALGNASNTPFGGVILIWNLTNRCNLYCKHCYSAANQEVEGELSYQEAISLVPQLALSGVKFAILSGGEPLLREDIYDIARELRRAGIRTYLSTNGLLINKENIGDIKSSFDYVGISLDGKPETHDLFRGKMDSFERALRSLELCMEEGIRTGLRFTLTQSTAKDLPFIFNLAEEIGVPKLYISHLVSAGRGVRLSNPQKRQYRELVRFIIYKAFEFHEKGIGIDVVTGNNEADAVLLQEEFSKRYPDRAEKLYDILLSWGGNQAGVRLVNIDHRGNVKPDPFFNDSLGNVRERSFNQIWNSNGLLSFLRKRPRPLKGRCSTCKYIGICNGNSRARAFFYSGNYAGEDPACYLS